jgi:hypothetical protein
MQPALPYTCGPRNWMRCLSRDTELGVLADDLPSAGFRNLQDGPGKPAGIGLVSWG